MVLNALNPILKDLGTKNGILPEHVIGISTLMQDSKGMLHKDPVLSKENPYYLNMKPEVLKSLKLTSRLHHPISTYSGKVQSIIDYIGKKPYLSAGIVLATIQCSCTAITNFGLHVLKSLITKSKLQNS